MRYGFILPGGTAAQQVELAEAAERAGWDAIFVWEAAFGVEPWSLLGAMAMRTSTIRLGTMLTPLPWRRPWKLASQLATVDQLSNGRAILSVGLGATDSALGDTGEVTDRRRRAELLDDGLDIIEALLSGPRVHAGTHHRVDLDRTMYDAVRPVQQPRPPIWIVGLWNSAKSMRRVLRGEGYLPNLPGGPGGPTPEQAAEMRSWLDQHAPAGKTIELVCEGETPAEDRRAAVAQVQAFADAGASWWLESRWAEDQHGAETLAGVRRRIEAGPPRP